MTLQRWKITLEYDGTDYYGFQLQPDGFATIQQRLEAALKAFCQQDIRIHVAGRTDAGVHALGQVCHFDLDYGDRDLTGPNLAKAINAHLGKDKISILSAQPVSDAFHARFNAKNKLYRYQILNRAAPPTLDANQFWHRRKLLDEKTMHQAAQYLLGLHDFSSFRAAECQAKTPEKTLDRCDVTRIGDHVMIEVEGKSFLHHMVRNIAGTLCMVGDGKWTPQDVKTALEAKKREAGGPTAPAHGLIMMRVDYD